MAQSNAGDPDAASQRAAGTLTANAVTPWVALDGPFNAFLGGPFTGPVALECSPDGGTTAFPCLFADGSPVVFTAPGHYRASEAGETNMNYRLNRGAGTGTATWRLSR